MYKDYYEDILDTEKRVIIDTSSVMHYKGFKKFVSQIEKPLEEHDKKILVLKEVWLELIRAYNSKNLEKRDAANQAISILSSHRNIFEIEDEEVFQYEMDNAFADKVLLSNLILQKTDASIVLITNDRMLSKDALEINHQASCRGHKIETCFIADSGKLLPGYNTIIEEDIVTPESQAEKVKTVYVKQEDSIALKVLIPIATLFTGVVIGKNSDKLVQFVKAIA